MTNYDRGDDLCSCALPENSNSLPFKHSNQYEHAYTQIHTGIYIFIYIYSKCLCVWHSVGDLCALRATVLNHRSTNFECDRFFLCENWYLGIHMCVRECESSRIYNNNRKPATKRNLCKTAATAGSRPGYCCVKLNWPNFFKCKAICGELFKARSISVYLYACISGIVIFIAL